MKRTSALLLLLILLTVILPIACKKSSGDQQNCKTCKVFGGDNNVIDEEKICTDKQESDLHSRFPGREIKCQ